MEDIFGNIWIFLLLLVSVPFSMWCFYVWIYEVLIKGMMDKMDPSRVVNRYKELEKELVRRDEFWTYQDRINQQEIDRQQRVEDQKKQVKVKAVRQNEWNAYNKLNR